MLPKGPRAGIVAADVDPRTSYRDRAAIADISGKGRAIHGHAETARRRDLPAVFDIAGERSDRQANTVAGPADGNGAIVRNVADERRDRSARDAALVLTSSDRARVDDVTIKSAYLLETDAGGPAAGAPHDHAAVADRTRGACDIDDLNASGGDVDVGDPSRDRDRSAIGNAAGQVCVVGHELIGANGDPGISCGDRAAIADPAADRAVVDGDAVLSRGASAVGVDRSGIADSAGNGEVALDVDAIDRGAARITHRCGCTGPGQSDSASVGKGRCGTATEDESENRTRSQQHSPAANSDADLHFKFQFLATAVHKVVKFICRI